MVKLDQLLEVIIKIIVKSQNKKSEIFYLEKKRVFYLIFEIYFLFFFILKLTFNKLKLLKKNKFLHIIKKHIQKL